MKSREKKKRVKEQQKEVETIKHAVEILSSLLPETDIDNFATLIDKLDQLVNDVSEQMKTFEDVTYVSVEKEYKKKRMKQLMKDVDKDKVSLTVNKSTLR